MSEPSIEWLNKQRGKVVRVHASLAPVFRDSLQQRSGIIVDVQPYEGSKQLGFAFAEPVRKGRPFLVAVCLKRSDQAIPEGWELRDGYLCYWCRHGEVTLVAEKRSHQAYLEVHFPLNSFHSMQSLKEALGTYPCMHRDHTAEDAPPATKRVLVNVHGTVYDVDVCDEHTDIHGTMRDTLPTRNR